MPQPSVPRAELPGHSCSIVDVRGVVDRMFPAAFDHMPFTARVFAENLIRKNTPAAWQAALAQMVHGRADADFPFHPARVVLQDLLGTPALSPSPPPRRFPAPWYTGSPRSAQMAGQESSDEPVSAAVDGRLRSRTLETRTVSTRRQTAPQPSVGHNPDHDRS